MKLNWIFLPFTLISNLQQASIWNIVKIGWGKENLNHQILPDNSLKVYYPAGSYSPSNFPQGGIGFYASPNEIFPSDHVMLSYEFKFDETFQPVLGGKLPGVLLSEPGDTFDLNFGSGGKHNNKTSSLRLAWRKDFSAEAYVYIPKNQTQEYYQTENYVKNEVYGDSLWRGIFTFKKNEWNKIYIRVKLNTFNTQGNANSDGILSMNINGVNKRFNKLIWTTNISTKITTILFSTFFGGSSNKYATPIDTWIYFKNFKIKNL